MCLTSIKNVCGASTIFYSNYYVVTQCSYESLKYKAELALVRNQNIDITNFEEKINQFKEGFARNYDLASRKFQTAIDEIDKTIIHLQKTKRSFIIIRQ
jgi:hypothetical protein